LKALWKFDEGFGTIANDQTGLNNGTIYGASYVEGKFDKALNFDSDVDGNGMYVNPNEPSDFVYIAPSQNHDLVGNQLTISSWIKLGDTGWGQSIIEKWFAYGLRAETSKIIASFSGLLPGDFQVPVNLDRNKWYNIACTYDGASVNVYLDGQLVGSTPISGDVSITDSDLRIGANQGGGQVTGDIDEVMILNRALSASQISALYQSNIVKIGNIYNSRKYSVIKPTASVEKAKSLRDWYNEDWVKRAPIDIDNSKNPETLTDYQVKMEVPYEIGMKNDFSDLRFTDEDKITELPYWIEEKTASDKATAWVKVPNIAASSEKTIYMYFGNSSADSVSDGEAAFSFFDDFSGSNLDSNKWMQINGGIPSFSNGLMTISANNVDPGKIVATAAPTGDNYILRSRFMATGGVGEYERTGLSIKTNTTVGTGYNYVLFMFENKRQFLDDAVMWGLAPGGPWSFDTFYTEEIFHDGLNVQARFDDGYWQLQPGWNGREGYPALNIGSYDATTVWDWAAVRKYSAIEPTVGFGKATSIKNWFDDEWKQRANISIDNSDNSEELTD
ncbi:hypothetical protein LCGC14_2340900, partial [marine sediment metagenome]